MSAHALHLENRDALAHVRSLFDRLESETAICRSIARSWQATSFPSFGPFQLDVAHQPIGAGSGDVFDVVKLTDGRWAIYLADCGGLASPSGCLIGMVVRRAVHEAAASPKISPGGILAECNRRLLSLPHVAVAMAVVIVEENSESLTMARAGLPTTMTIPADGPSTIWQTPGPLLGLAPAEFPSESGPFRVGDSLCLSSAPLSTTRQPSAAAFIATISPDIRPTDDRTVLVLQRLPVAAIPSAP